MGVMIKADEDAVKVLLALPQSDECSGWHIEQCAGCRVEQCPGFRIEQNCVVQDWLTADCASSADCSSNMKSAEEVRNALTNAAILAELPYIHWLTQSMSAEI